jgi:hypothetical protein
METNKTDNNYFNVWVFGDYYLSTSMGNVVKPFGPVPLRMRTWDSCQMLARKHVLPNLILKADPEFKSIRKCIVFGVKTADDQPVFGLNKIHEQRTNRCRGKIQRYPTPN